MTQTFECPGCKKAHSVAELLARARPVGCLGVLAAEVDGCRHEYVIRGDSIWLGYIYAAGAPHFCPMIEIEVPGLRVDSYEPLVISVDGKTIRPD